MPRVYLACLTSLLLASAAAGQCWVRYLAPSPVLPHGNFGTHVALDGDRAVVSRVDGPLLLFTAFDLNTGARTDLNIPSPTDAYQISIEGNQAVIAGGDEIYLVDLTTGDVAQVIPLTPTATDIRTSGFDGRYLAMSVKVLPSGNKLAIYDTVVGSWIHVIDPGCYSDDTIFLVAVDDGHAAISDGFGSGNGGVCVQRLSDGAVMFSRLPAGDQILGGLDIEGSRIAIPIRDSGFEYVEVWDWQTGTLLLTHPAYTDAHDTRVQLSSQHLLNLGTGTVEVVDILSGEVRAPIVSPWWGVEIDKYKTSMAVDGDRVLIGARLHGSSNPGKAVLYRICPVESQSFCGPSPSDWSGRLRAAGSATVTDNEFLLVANGLIPTTTSLPLVSASYGSGVIPPGSDGLLCLQNPIGRGSLVPTAGLDGAVTVEVPIDLLPLAGGPHAVQSGETWHFQLWYRYGGSSFFTEGCSVTFQ